jgi:hypothetical protein
VLFPSPAHIIPRPVPLLPQVFPNDPPAATSRETAPRRAVTAASPQRVATAGARSPNLGAVPTSVFGLPLHVLVVHGVVVLLPLSIVAVIAVALSARFRHRFGLATLALTFMATVLVPIATQTGETLRSELPRSSAITTHAHLGQLLVPFAAALGVAVLAVVALDVYRRRLALAGPDTGPGAGGRADAPTSGVVERVEMAAWQAVPDGLRNAGAGRRAGALASAAATVAVVLALATGVLVVLVGDSGARALWAHYPGLHAPSPGGLSRP